MPMIGAQALIGSLVGAGVDVCFMNPGTSEMHFVSALDSVPDPVNGLLIYRGRGGAAATQPVSTAQMTIPLRANFDLNACSMAILVLMLVVDAEP